MNETFELDEPFGTWEGHNALAPAADEGSNAFHLDPSEAFEARGSKGYGQRDVTRSGATPFDPHRNDVLQPGREDRR